MTLIMKKEGEHNEEEQEKEEDEGRIVGESYLSYLKKKGVHNFRSFRVDAGGVLLADPPTPRSTTAPTPHHDRVALFDIALTPGLGQGVEAIGGATGEDHLALGSRSDKPLHLLSCFLERACRTLTQLMDAAMNVGTILTVVRFQTVDHALRLM